MILFNLVLPIIMYSETYAVIDSSLQHGYLDLDHDVIHYFHHLVHNIAIYIYLLDLNIAALPCLSLM